MIGRHKVKSVCRICVVLAGNTGTRLKNNVTESESQRAGVLRLCFCEAEVPQVRLVGVMGRNTVAQLSTSETANPRQLIQERFISAYGCRDTSLWVIGPSLLYLLPSRLL